MGEAHDFIASGMRHNICSKKPIPEFGKAMSPAAPLIKTAAQAAENASCFAKSAL